MKRTILLVFMLGYGSIYAQLLSQQVFEETKKSSFSVELGNLIVVVPSAPTERQCQFVAYRSVNNPYFEQFDQQFFDAALVVFAYYDNSEVIMLKDWGVIFSSDSNLLVKEKFVRFLRTTEEDYNLSTKMLSSNNAMEVWQIGKVKLFVYKESINKRKNKISIPDGYYYVTTKQLLN